MSIQIKLTDGARQALQGAAIIRDGVYLGAPGTLDQKTYKELTKVLDAVGFKWSRKAGRHIKPGADAQKEVGEILGSGGAVNERQTFQFFPTAPAVARRMVDELLLSAKGLGKEVKTVLEPSVGLGALVMALRTARTGLFVVGVELNEKLHRLPNGVQTDWMVDEMHYGDFLKWRSSWTFDAVIMNPPFSGQQDIRHVLHALSFLAPGGVLVTLMWPGWRTSTTKLAKAFRDKIGSVRQSTLEPGEADGGLTKNSVDMLTIYAK